MKGCLSSVIYVLTRALRFAQDCRSRVATAAPETPITSRIVNAIQGKSGVFNWSTKFCAPCTGLGAVLATSWPASRITRS